MDNIRNELGKLRNEVWHILQMDYSKRADFIPAILGRIDGILETPKRNCDVGTVEEQENRFLEHCYKQSIDTGLCLNCPLFGKQKMCSFAWSQMPYESEVK